MATINLNGEDMNPVSAKALAWSAGLLMVLALGIISPAGTFPLLILAAICAAIPGLFAAKRIRVVSLILLGISLVLAATYFPDFKRDQEAYRRRAKEQAAKPSLATPPDQGATGQ